MIDDEGLTVEMWARKWLEVYKPEREYTNKEYYTHKMYESIIRVHIIPAIGFYRLKDLKSFHLTELINKKLSEGYTRTVEKIYITINQILKQAVKNELVHKNVMVDVAMPKVDKKNKRVLTDREKEYLDNADFTLKQQAFMFTLLYTGLRKGEIIALTHNDVDMRNRTITVNKSIVIKSNQSEIKDCPKSNAGYRVIPIIDKLFYILQEYLTERNGIYVFPSAHGQLMSHSSFNYFWGAIIKNLNIAAGGTDKIRVLARDITPHMFRHTYATSLYYANIGAKTAQYLLGHASLRMTMELYTH